MAGLEIRMEYSGGRTGMIRALAAAQVLAWLITAALLLAMAFVMWKFQPDMGKMQLGIYGIYGVGYYSALLYHCSQKMDE